MGYPLPLRFPSVLSSQTAVAAAFPTVEAALSQGFATPATAHLVNMPATVNSGDLLLIAVTAMDVDAINPAMTTPTGWTAEYNSVFPNDSTASSRALFSKVADGTEGGTTVDVVTADDATMAVNVYRISGWDGALTGVEFAGPTADAFANPGVFDPPSVTASWGSAKNLFIEVIHGVDDDAGLTSSSTNYGNNVTAVSGAGTNAGCCTHSARRELEAATDDPDDMTLTEGERACTTTIVVRPAA